MRKVLNYTVPPIKCFLHHAFPLGVFWDENDENVMNWFCLNYNYILAGQGPKEYLFTFLINYFSIPFLQKRDIYGDELEKYLATHKFSTLVKESIDNGNLVEVLVDMYYIKGQPKYEKIHSMHEILILGYDDEKETFIIRDYFNYVFSELEIEQSQVVPFERCSYYGDNVAMKLFRKRQHVFPFDRRSFILQIKDYYDSINPYYRFSCVHGSYFEPWEKIFGMVVYDKVIDYIETGDCIDYRPLRMIQEHFDGMRIKMDYIISRNYIDLECIENMRDFYISASEKTEIIVRLAVLQTMSPNEKKEKMKQRVITQLRELIESERKVLKTFIEEAESKKYDIIA